MGSKKHKDKEKDHKRKRRHKSRSRSPSSKERREERKRHRYEREHEAQYEPGGYDGQDRSAYEYDEQSYPKEIEAFDYNHKSAAPAPVEKKYIPSQPMPSSGSEASLSIEETNRIRAKLGLKPLEVNNEESKETVKKTSTDNEDVHRPAISITKQKETAKLRERMEKMRDKRKHNQKLSKIKTLGESDSDDDMQKWVQKNRKVQKEKAIAEKRAKMLEEMDAEFGIGNLVEEEFHSKQKTYSSKDLKGLKVQHNIDRFKEGQTVILTLEDRGVLDEEGDTLMNVNLADDEFADKNVENKKKKPDYRPYDEAEQDEYGMFKPTNILDKYDEEIEGMKKQSFELGTGGKYDSSQDKQMDRIREQLRMQSQDLASSKLKLVSEYYTTEEMKAKAQFKKVKKKVRKIRKKTALKADDLLPLPDQVDDEGDFGSRSRGRGKREVIDDDAPTDDTSDWYGSSNPETGYVPGDVGYPEDGYRAEGSLAPVVIDYGHKTTDRPVVIDYGHKSAAELGRVKMEVEDTMNLDDTEIMPDEDLTGVVVDEDDAESELQNALTKARKLKQKQKKTTAEMFALKLASKKSDDVEMKVDEDGQDGNIILNSTSEFCRTLGEIPTYGQSGNRDEDQEDLMDFEKELIEERKRQMEEDQTSGWNRVEIDETPVDISGEEKAVLDDEPVVNQGVGAALALATKKGYLDKEQKKKSGGSKHVELEAQNYSIEDKRYDDLDEKYRKRDRYGGGGVITDFKEKDSYKPEVKLEYVDDTGRLLNAKEAFRQLSHRFHGKGSGKRKQEKRQKKLQEEHLMKMMSSTDTPLGTLNLLQEKQKSEKSAFVILTGNKGLTTNSIQKPI